MTFELPAAAPQKPVPDPALTVGAKAVNSFGLELHRSLAKEKPGANLLISPYSIEYALALAARGAEGDTLAEMRRVLHAPGSDEDLIDGLAAVRKELSGAVIRSTERVKQSADFGGPSTPIKLEVANNLFAQKGYPFRKEFADYVSRDHSPIELMDFRSSPENSRRSINAWIGRKTSSLIPDLIPPGGLDETTRLVIANALYFKASWEDEFYDTEEAPFHLADGTTVKVPLMFKEERLSAAKREGYTAVSIPYAGHDLAFLVLLPDTASGLSDLESKLSAALLSEAANLPAVKTELKMPKLKIKPPAVDLAGQLQKLGMKTAFDRPTGSANFNRLAERKPDDYLALSKVFHQTYLVLDEKGTEAAAATAVLAIAAGALPDRSDPLVITVDRPFLFAIQHVKSGACLFLGRVMDPR